jgi:hypothetical protein
VGFRATKVTPSCRQIYIKAKFGAHARYSKLATDVSRRSCPYHTWPGRVSCVHCAVYNGCTGCYVHSHCDDGFQWVALCGGTAATCSACVTQGLTLAAATARDLSWRPMPHHDGPSQCAHHVPRCVLQPGPGRALICCFRPCRSWLRPIGKPAAHAMYSATL